MKLSRQLSLHAPPHFTSSFYNVLYSGSGKSGARLASSASGGGGGEEAKSVKRERAINDK